MLQRLITRSKNVISKSIFRANRCCLLLNNCCQLTESHLLVFSCLRLDLAQRALASCRLAGAGCAAAQRWRTSCRCRLVARRSRGRSTASSFSESLVPNPVLIWPWRDHSERKTSRSVIYGFPFSTFPAKRETAVNSKQVQKTKEPFFDEKRLKKIIQKQIFTNF